MFNWLRLRNDILIIFYYFLEEDISEEEDVKANETGSISQKRSHSQVLLYLILNSNSRSFFFCYC